MKPCLTMVDKGGHGSGLDGFFYPTWLSQVCKAPTCWPSIKVVGSDGSVDRFWRVGDQVYPVNQSIRDQSIVGWRSWWRRGGDDGGLAKPRRDLTISDKISLNLTRSDEFSSDLESSQARLTNADLHTVFSSFVRSSLNSDDFLNKNPKPESK